MCNGTLCLVGNLPDEYEQVIVEYVFRLKYLLKVYFNIICEIIWICCHW